MIFVSPVTVMSDDPRPLPTEGSVHLDVHNIDDCEFLEKLRIMNPLCPDCKDILEQVTISSERDNHVIQMHYSSERVQNKSTFTNNIQLHFFF